MKLKNFFSKIKIDKHSLLNALYYQLMGALICLVILFYLAGGKNYFRLYGELNKVIDTYDTITKNYYGKVDKEDLRDTAEATTFLENVEGHYEGLGITIKLDTEKRITIVKVFDNTPAKEAGLKENDIITKVDDIDLNNKTTNYLVEYIKNNNNKKVKLIIIRDNKEKEITLSTSKITMPTVSSKIIDKENNIGYINITIFSTVTEKQFKEELEKLEKKKIKALIIDVRNNSGGYLNVVTNITSMFLEKGKIIYQLKDDTKTTKIKDKTKEQRDYPIAVLTNRASASASEILAGALKESYDAIVVGTNTYGKGTVQKTKKLQDGSMIKYTIQKWLTPKGIWVEDIGVSPTEYIEFDNTKVTDNQLDKSIELIKGKIQ